MSSDPKVLHFLFVYQHSPEPRRKGTGFVRSSLRVDIGSMSIQESLKRFKSNENLPIPLDHLDGSSSCSVKLIESPEEHTLGSFDEVRSQRISEILDSIGGLQMFTVKKSLRAFLRLRQVGFSVFFCAGPRFSASSTCKIQPVVDRNNSFPSYLQTRTLIHQKEVESLLL